MHHLRNSMARAGLGTGVLLFALAASAGTAAAAGPTTWSAMAGTGDASGVAANKYYPANITIDVGDTITWRAAGNAHTVSLLGTGGSWPTPDSTTATAPAGGSTYDGTTFVASGLILPLPPGVPVPPDAPPGSTASYSLTFPAAGTYAFHCLIHPGMAGTITVQAAGTAYPQTQAQIDAAAATAKAADIATGHALEAAYKPSVTTNADGTKTYDFAAGLGQDNIEILRFISGQASLRVGDSISWTNYSTGEPHSVSFGPEPQGPAAEGPSGGSTYPASGFVSSGLFLGVGPGSHTYKLTFTKAGSYKYFCVLHDIVGMLGSVNVTAAPVATLPPTSTVSTVGGAATTGSTPWALLALALALAAGVGSLVRLTRRGAR